MRLQVQVAGAGGSVEGEMDEVALLWWEVSSVE